ncbi:hypothetical protein DFP72DRAFT_1059353 [Ephemerocybe angulata]|uniref:Myb/SANT-like domain-containing protein n=1 Tax=Ephemerocybe angulata TaxID=980116 RepID=A0A8H6IHP8_9AGAR|nr:hypothetical protein DFP72DRAFT_1059353 [Tulosesus angulatus]
MPKTTEVDADEASVEGPAPVRAIFNAEIDRKLVTAVQAIRATGKGRSGNLQDAQWTSIMRTLAGTEVETGGAEKTAASWKGRFGTLKAEYNTVKTLRDMSGFGWDNEKQIVTASDDVWDRWIAKNPKKKKWRTTAFPLYDDIGGIVDGTVATGSNAFRPSSTQSTEPETNTPEPPSSPPPSASYAPASSSSTITRKRSAIDLDSEDNTPGYTSSNQRKRAGASTTRAQGMLEIASAVKDLSGSFSQSSENTTPVRRQRAIKLIQSDNLLSETDELRAFRLMRRDPSLADTLLAITPGTKRARYIQLELEEDG